MLDYQIAYILLSFLMLSYMYLKNSQCRKLKDILATEREKFANEFKANDDNWAFKFGEKNKALTLEYGLKKMLGEALDATKVEADAAKAKMVELNDLLNISREKEEIAKSDVDDLTQETTRLHVQLNASTAEAAGLKLRVKSLEAECTRLDLRLQDTALISVKKAKKVAKKSTKKKKVK